MKKKFNFEIAVKELSIHTKSWSRNIWLPYNWRRVLCFTKATKDQGFKCEGGGQSRIWYEILKHGTAYNDLSIRLDFKKQSPSRAFALSREAAAALWASARVKQLCSLSSMLLVFSKRVLFLILSLCLSLSSSPRLGHSTTDTYLRDTAGAFQRDPLGPRLSNLSKLRSALSSASIRGPLLFGRQLEQLVWVDNGSGFGSASSRCSVTLLISKNSSSTSSTSQASCSFCCAACSSGELSEHGTRSWSASSSKVSSEKKHQ